MECRLYRWEDWEVKYDLPNSYGFSVRRMGPRTGENGQGLEWSIR